MNCQKYNVLSRGKAGFASDSLYLRKASLDFVQRLGIAVAYDYDPGYFLRPFPALEQDANDTTPSDETHTEFFHGGPFYCCFKRTLP